MGLEAECEARWRGRVVRGKALLETDELLFRGDARLRLPFKSLTRVAVEDGWLLVESKEGAAAFRLGPAAGTWADRILHPKSRIDKLGVKPGHAVAVLGVKDAEFLKELAAKAAAVTTGRPRSGVDVLFFGADSRAALWAVGDLAARLRPDGALWIVAPKGRDDPREADVLAAGKQAGLVDVKVVRFSETHTAHKFVVPLAKRPPR